jgi:kinetochore protein Mis13/DSN1
LESLIPKDKPVQLPHESPTPPPRATKKKRSKEQRQDVEEREEPVPAPPAKSRTKKPEKEKVKKHADKVAMAGGNSSLHGTVDDSNSRIPLPSGEVSKIKLPTSDTPIQRKNQQFRKGPGGERRRSSLGRRGRRASSMMQEGIIGMGTTKCPKLEGESESDIAFFFLAAEPHSEISHKEFYKHIDEEQMENARMKQLLTWCGSRELDRLRGAAPPGSSSSDIEGSARHVGKSAVINCYKFG